MASKTTYYGLDMPGYNDIADIDVINGNMDKIDVQMKKNADSAQQSKDIVSDEYSATNTYAVGDYCIYENALYKCKTAITTGEAFDINKWVQTTCGTEFVALNSNLDTLEFGEVAGGKNLFNPKCLLNATYDEKTDKITVSNNTNKALDMVFKENTQYTFSAYIKQSSSSTNNRFNVTYTDGTTDIAFLFAQSTSEVYLSATSKSGKTISEVKWYYSSSGTATFRNFQIEEWSTATPYEPYIPSVKMLANETDSINDSLGDYNLDNKYDGCLYQGYWSNGVLKKSNNDVCNKNLIECVPNKSVTVKTQGQKRQMGIGFLDENKNFISSMYVDYVSEVSSIAPSNAKYATYNITGVTIENVGYIAVYINNAIDELNNDLGVKPVYIPSNSAFGAILENASYVSGKICVLSFKFKTSAQCTMHSPIVPNGIKYFSETGETLKPLAKSFLNTNKYNNGFYIDTSGNIFVGDEDVPNGTTLYVTGSFIIE